MMKNQFLTFKQWLRADRLAHKSILLRILLRECHIKIVLGSVAACDSMAKMSYLRDKQAGFRRVPV